MLERMHKTIKEKTVNYSRMRKNREMAEISILVEVVSNDLIEFLK